MVDPDVLRLNTIPLVVWAWLGACTALQAQDTVLVLNVGSTGFVNALQIELGDQYRVHVSTDAVPKTLTQRIDLATRLVESEHALATVWIEQGERSALLHVVGQRAGRALLEVVSAPEARGLDLERMLSIKLAELLSQLRAAPVHVLMPEPVTRAEPPPRAASASSRLSGALTLGPRFDMSLGAGWSRFGLSVALAPELTFGSFRTSLGLGLDAYPWLDVRANSNEVSLSEVAPRLQLGASWWKPGIALSILAGASWSFLSVRGRTALGYENGATLDVLGYWIALAAERAFAPAFSLGARVELHGAARRMHFEVNEQGVLDRGRFRLTLGIDITFRADVAR
jgi:hypothetical protein